MASPETILWIEVVKQAYADLTKPEYRKDAEQFFIRERSSFDWISHAIGIDANKIRNRIKSFLAS
jgi:hypothetical protein